MEYKQNRHAMPAISGVTALDGGRINPYPKKLIGGEQLC
jgi:hypothetical protein